MSYKAGVMREMDEFKAANWSFGGDLYNVEDKKPNTYGAPTKSNAPAQSTPGPPPSKEPVPPPSATRTRTIPSTKCSNNNMSSNSKYSGNQCPPARSFNDAELKRQRRVVKYKSYAVESKMRASFRNGFRWIKNKYCEFIHGC